MSASDRTKTLNDALTSVIASLDKEEELKKSLREALDPLFDVVRSSTAELNKIHSSPSSSHADIAQKTIEIVSSAKERWLTVASIIPEGEYHRHAYALGPVIRGLTTNVVFSRFILTDELTPAFQVSDIIGLEQPETRKITLTAEDYLLGVIGMVNELASSLRPCPGWHRADQQPRLSINSVTAQNYDLPQKIASFVNDIFASYSLLNLRNTELRRKFDSLKYDLKRCEDVVYDLTLRGLTKAPTSA